MSKSTKNKSAIAKFYEEPAMVEEVYSGFLHKSPAQLPVLKSFNSWKRRFFVLSKTDEDAHHLTYYSNEKREKPLGMIDLSKISLMLIGVEKHPMWDWIQKHFNCSPDSVLFLTVNEDTQKHRDYFLIGENSDVDCWHNALLKALKKDKRSRSTSEPERCPEPKVEDPSNERQSAPELREQIYDVPRKYSEPSVSVERKILLSVKEDKDETDGEQDLSPEDSSEYMPMASVQRALEDDKQKADTACTQTNETHSHLEEICISQNSLKNSLILTQEEGKPCVSECRQIQDSRLFHKGDQILAFNDLLIDTVEEIHTYVRRLSKDEAKLTVRRFLGSQPLHSEPCTSH